MTRIVVLLSLGRHPVSGRPRLPPAEAAALGLARQFASRSGGVLVGLHAGPADAAGPLREALGLGAAELAILDLTPGSDPLPALVESLRRPADLILAASAAEAGPATGTLPYLVAARLGLPLADAVTGLSPEDTPDSVHLETAEPGGLRRLVRMPLPAMAVLRSGAGQAGLPALGAMRRGVVTLAPARSEADPLAAAEIRPARRRPRRLDAPRAAGPAAGGIHHPASPEAAADLILDYLRREGVLPSGPIPGNASNEQV